MNAVQSPPTDAQLSLAAGSRGYEAVPVGERLRVSQYLRFCAIALVLLCTWLLPDLLRPGRVDAVLLTLGYAAVAVLAIPVIRLMRTRLSALFSLLLMLDGIWLTWCSYLTGGASSPVRYLILLHVAAVALIASYRTGLKLALWQSLLLVCVYNGERGGVLVRTDPVSGAGSAGHRLAALVVVLWLVAISTAALSAVNERELRRRRHDLEALTSLAESLERTSDSPSVARTLLDSVSESFGFGRGLVVAGSDGSLPLLASLGLDEAAARRPGRPGTSAVVERAHELHQTLLVEGLDPAADAWLTRLLPDAGNLVVAPLSAEGRPVGALILEHGPKGSGRLSRRVVAAVERAASYGALALRGAWLLEQVQRLAATDGLTKIANRRTFESALEREVARAVRSDEPVSLVIIDIDHFKRLNDEHGHQAGDEVLRNVAAALSCECRDFDTPARYGGEEFVVVLPGCGAEEAPAIAERLRRAVSDAPAVVPMTASAGVATFPAHARDADTLVRAADEALYQSKAHGRNRTTVSAGLAPHNDVEELLRRTMAERLGAGQADS